MNTKTHNNQKELQALRATAPDVQGEPVEDALHARAMDLYRPPFRYDSLGGYIWDSENNMVADNHDLQDDAVLRIRGWGRISYMDAPEALQDKMGELVAAALTAYWTQPAEQQPDVARLVEALARCRHQASYSIGEEDALRIQLGKVRDIVNETLSALPAHRKGDQP